MLQRILARPQTHRVPPDMRAKTASQNSGFTLGIPWMEWHPNRMLFECVHIKSPRGQQMSQKIGSRPLTPAHSHNRTCVRMLSPWTSHACKPVPSLDVRRHTPHAVVCVYARPRAHGYEHECTRTPPRAMPHAPAPVPAQIACVSPGSVPASPTSCGLLPKPWHSSRLLLRSLWPDIEFFSHRSYTRFTARRFSSHCLVTKFRLICLQRRESFSP